MCLDAAFEAVDMAAVALAVAKRIKARVERIFPLDSIERREMYLWEDQSISEMAGRRKT